MEWSRSSFNTWFPKFKKEWSYTPSVFQSYIFRVIDQIFELLPRECLLNCVKWNYREVISTLGSRSLRKSEAIPPSVFQSYIFQVFGQIFELLNRECLLKCVKWNDREVISTPGSRSLRKSEAISHMFSSPTFSESWIKSSSFYPDSAHLTAWNGMIEKFFQHTVFVLKKRKIFHFYY